jgi:3'-phosphoadenosine 5'-phosphosulfate (PAPS) 3'-phosphatase
MPLEVSASAIGDVLRGVGARLVAWQEESPRGGVRVGDQLKTEADRRAHVLLSRALRELAELPVVSEEDDASLAGARRSRYWLIDPLDGTASWAEGYRTYVTQAALMDEGRPKVAGVFAPALGLLYLASRDGGATLNGQAITAKAAGAASLVLIDNTPEPRGVTRRVFDELACTGYLESGSIGLKICRVADGTADLFVKDVAVRDWDVAPGDLVLNEAGGALATLDAEAFDYDGSFEKRGLVAAKDIALLRRVKRRLGERPDAMTRGQVDGRPAAGRRGSR